MEDDSEESGVDPSTVTSGSDIKCSAVTPKPAERLLFQGRVPWLVTLGVVFVALFGRSLGLWILNDFEGKWPIVFLAPIILG